MACNHADRNCWSLNEWMTKWINEKSSEHIEGWKSNKTKPDAWLPHYSSHQGQYWRSLEHLGRSSELKKLKIAKKVTRGPTNINRPTNQRTNRWTKLGLESYSTQLKSRDRLIRKLTIDKKTNCTNWQTDKQTDWQTKKKTNWRTDKPTNWQIRKEEWREKEINIISKKSKKQTCQKIAKGHWRKA